MAATGWMSQSVAVSPVSADPITANGSILLTGAGAVRFSPPTLADLNGDGRQEILVGTADGKVFALKYISTSPHLQVMWSHNTATDLGCPTTIGGAMSAADLNGDGNIEVVVPVGNATPNTCGGLVVLDAQNGNTKWAYHTFDANSDGLSDGVYSTPALGDIDNDGKLEIIFGSFDYRVYAFKSDGTLVPGWPKFVRDSVWSSPALADLDNDGFLEIVIGVDAHAEGAPFNTPDGGCLYAFRGNGQVLWRQCINQTIGSSPAIGDLNNDGQLEIVHGTGEYYNNSTDGYKIYVRDSLGNIKWTDTTSGYTNRSPALGDIDGDGKVEVVLGSQDKKLYAWKQNGTRLWSVMPTNLQGNTSFPGAPIIADYNNDGKPDVFTNIYWDSAILNGTNGAQLTANYFPNNPLPAYYTNCTTQDNAPAIGDLDGDGKQELIVASGNNSGADCGTGQVNFWRLNVNSPSNPTTAPWPMFGQNARHTRVYPQNLAFDAEVVSHTIPSVMFPGLQRSVNITLKNVGTSTWIAAGMERLGSVAISDPFTTTTRFNLNAGESVAPGQTRTFTINLQAPSTQGYYDTQWRMVNDLAGQWFGRTIAMHIKVGNQPALQVLTTQGIYAGGLATTPLPPPAGFGNWPAAKLWKLTSDKRGYYMLDSLGGYWYGGDTFPLVSKGQVQNLQDMVLGPDGVSYYELIGDGTIYGCDTGWCNRTFNPSTPTGIQARSLALTSDGKGVYVADGFGNVYRGGNASALSAPVGLPLGSDLIRRIKLTPDGTGYYLMDMYGRIWNGGSAPVLSLGYSPRIGEDWARDFALTESRDGFYLLSKSGAIYSGGTAVPLTVNVPPTSTNDIGRALELVDTRGYTSPYLVVNPSALNLSYALGEGNPTFSIAVSNGGGPGSINWTATPPPGVTLSATSGTVSTSNVVTGSISAGGYQPGTYTIGSILFTGTLSGKQPAAGSPQNISLTLRVYSQNKLFLPLVIR